MGGYAGKILYIDLTSGNIETKPLDLKFAREYIGGLGFSTRIYLDLIKNAKKAVQIPVSASINCVSSADWISFAAKIQDVLIIRRK